MRGYTFFDSQLQRILMGRVHLIYRFVENFLAEFYKFIGKEVSSDISGPSNADRSSKQRFKSIEHDKTKYGQRYKLFCQENH